MLKKVFGLVLIAALASCKPATEVGADGYKFGQPQYEKQSVQVNVVAYKTRAEFNAAAKKYGVNSPELAAFSVLRPPFDQCAIHMISPSVKYEPEYVGHEFLHCFYGQWHTDNQSRS